MKTLIHSIIALLICTTVYSQNIDTLTPIPLYVTHHLTTNLRFPSPIFKVDFGSSDIIGKKMGATENVLLLKAAKPNFSPTNLSVYLNNGSFFSFLVRYSDSLASFNYSFQDSPTRQPNGLLFSNPADNHQLLTGDSSLVSCAPPFLRVRSSNAGLTLTLTGIYVKDDLFWLALRAANNTALPIHPIFIHCTGQDRRELKQTATQSLPITPIYFSSPSTISPDTTQSLLLALKPFPLSKTKNLLLEWGEPTGQRLLLSIRESLFLKAKKLPGHE